MLKTNGKKERKTGPFLATSSTVPISVKLDNYTRARSIIALNKRENADRWALFFRLCENTRLFSVILFPALIQDELGLLIN